MTQPSAAIDPKKLRLLRRLPDGTVKHGGLELLEGEGMLWLDLSNQSDPEVDLIASHFGFHPLTIEDLRHLDQRPKLEEYDGYLFIVQHGFGPLSDDYELELRELHAFLGKDFLVTVHSPPLPEVEKLFARACADPGLAARGPDFLFYLLSDAIADGYFATLDELAEVIERLEEEVISKPGRAIVESILTLKRTLMFLRRVASPARDVIGNLAKRGAPLISERTALYFRDVHDHLMRVAEALEADRDLLSNVLDAYLSMAAARTNDIVKQLTIFSVTFLPLTFITGFFGQNFTSFIPFERPWLFGLVTAACFAVPSGMLAWFARKGWF